MTTIQKRVLIECGILIFLGFVVAGAPAWATYTLGLILGARFNAEFQEIP